MDGATHFAVALAALAIEAAFGYPDLLFRAIGHPVSWIGAGIGRLDAAFNRDTMPEARRRRNGTLCLIGIVAVPALIAGAIQVLLFACLPRPAAILITALLASSLIAQRSLHTHVRAVAGALASAPGRSGLAAGRREVAKIVGRDPESLDEAGVARAAIESLAENFSDGIVAPAFWCLLLGLPGIVAYKAINTADSMIGHLTERHAAFGRAAARLDDLVNLPASRLAALWLILAAAIRSRTAAAAFDAVRSDARHHRSPNAGWPEAAMAGALGLRLAGPRTYGETLIQDPWQGSGRAEADAADIDRALALYRAACLIQFAVAAIPAFLIWRG